MSGTQPTPNARKQAQPTNHQLRIREAANQNNAHRGFRDTTRDARLLRVWLAAGHGTEAAMGGEGKGG